MDAEAVDGLGGVRLKNGRSVRLRFANTFGYGRRVIIPRVINVITGKKSAAEVV